MHPMGRKLAIAGGEPTLSTEEAVRWPVITEEDRRAVLQVLDRGILNGPYAPAVKGLEADFARYTGARHCLATNSGTSALHIAVAAAGIGPGDEVITTAFSFLASALCVLQQNAVPVFCDIDPDTFNLDWRKLPSLLTPRTRAIIPVHIHGLPADMDEILDFARSHDLTVIEDAAQAHGATYKGRPVGTLGDMGCFSLQGSKNLPAGEGGLFVTNDDTLRHEANMVRMFGENIHDDTDVQLDLTHPLEDPREYNAYKVGWMYRTTEMTAALAQSQLRRLEANNDRAQRNGRYLTRHLAEIPGITPQHVPEDRTSVYHKYRIRLDPEEWDLDVPRQTFRDRVLAALAAEGVEVALWQTVPLPAQDLFRTVAGYGKGCPWTCHSEAPRTYDPGDYPQTARLLEDSILIGSESYPLFPQPLSLMEQYVAAIRKVFDSRESLLQALEASG